jgi:predicted DCC family thiol-disulfide oxidoreductase YuxK
MEVKTPQQSKTLSVYWDGQCPLCNATKSYVIALDTHHRLKFLDFRDPNVALTATPRFSSQELAHEMRVHMPDDTWRSGYYGWAAMISVMPLFWWVAAIMKSWAFADIGPKFYRKVADNRYEISHMLHLPELCDEAGSCRISTT